MVQTKDELFADVLFVPEGQRVHEPSVSATFGIEIPALWSGPVVIWDPATGLCTTNCEDVHEWRQLRYEQGGGYVWWHNIGCAIGTCAPDDYERDLIKRKVDEQGFFDHDGTLNADLVRDNLLQMCWQYAATPSTGCNLVTVANAAE